MLKLENFFGLSMDENSSDIHSLLSALGIDKEIRETKVVKNLIKQCGRDAAIVNVAIRQQTLKSIHNLLNEEMLDFDPLFYNKEVNTSSAHDRRYNAEDKLIDFALLVASTKNKKIMSNDSLIITSKQLRESLFQGTRFDKCWDLLSDQSQHIISAFRDKK